MMVVAIDGPAGVGKSTIAKSVADRLGFYNANSGSMYRALALSVLRDGAGTSCPESISLIASRSNITVENDRIVLNGEDVEDLLRTDEVDKIVAQVSSIPDVRNVVNEVLRRIAAGRDIVVEGRDITTVVFPNAEVKFYFDASPKTRALRRFQQGTSSLSLEEIERAIQERDELDRTKPQGRLKRADDAIYLDTSHLTIDEVCERVVKIIREHIQIRE